MMMDAIGPMPYSQLNSMLEQPGDKT